MATIVSASYTLDNHTQVDGRRYVYETFVDDEGYSYPWTYLAAVNTDYDAVLAQHQVQMDEQLADAEYAAILRAAQ